MTWVKVCGLTRRRDVEVAVAAGADAVGFVIAPESPRRIAPKAAALLGAGVGATRVLVTVDLEPDDLLALARQGEVDGVQPAGAFAAAAASAAAAAGYLVLRPVPVADRADVSAVPVEQIPLLDTASPDRHGGTGRTFDWELAKGIGRDFVLAGGLDPVNVADAVRLVQPWGVDASSGLETAPGIKDPGKVRDFVEEAKSA